jgi:hypothetical protein
LPDHHARHGVLRRQPVPWSLGTGVRSSSCEGRHKSRRICALILLFNAGSAAANAPRFDQPRIDPVGGGDDAQSRGDGEENRGQRVDAGTRQTGSRRPIERWGSRGSTPSRGPRPARRDGRLFMPVSAGTTRSQIWNGRSSACWPTYGAARQSCTVHRQPRRNSPRFGWAQTWDVAWFSPPRYQCSPLPSSCYAARRSGRPRPKKPTQRFGATIPANACRSNIIRGAAACNPEPQPTVP